jgi:clusterin-associated protein 1
MRQLASDITSKGAAIYDFLGKEAALRAQRNQVLQKNYELTQVESALQKKMQSMEQQIQQTQEAIGNIAGNEAQLDQKIEKKTAELQRLRKRLDTMKNIR